MSISLRVIDCPAGSFRDPSIQVGDMWRWPDQDRDGRECWIIMLPGRAIWYSTLATAQGGGWDFTGIAPAVSVSPSIWVDPPRGWHGWVRDGELVDA